MELVYSTQYGINPKGDKAFLISLISSHLIIKWNSLFKQTNIGKDFLRYKQYSLFMSWIDKIWDQNKFEFERIWTSLMFYTPLTAI